MLYELDWYSRAAGSPGQLDLGLPTSTCESLTDRVRKPRVGSQPRTRRSPAARFLFHARTIACEDVALTSGANAITTHGPRGKTLTRGDDEHVVRCPMQGSGAVRPDALATEGEGRASKAQQWCCAMRRWGSRDRRGARLQPPHARLRIDQLAGRSPSAAGAYRPAPSTHPSNADAPSPSLGTSAPARSSLSRSGSAPPGRRTSTRVTTTRRDRRRARRPLDEIGGVGGRQDRGFGLSLDDDIALVVTVPSGMGRGMRSKARSPRGHERPRCRRKRRADPL